MIAPVYKEPLRLLWDRFWSSGIANPLTAIEQISYLLFLRMLETTSPDLLADQPLRCRWSHIRTLSQAERFDAVRETAFPFLKSLGSGDGAFARAMEDAVFVVPTPALLSFAVDRIDELPLGGEAGDVGGDLYEFLLSELTLAGKNGQFRTPRHLVRTIVELVEPRLGERICDPAAGTGGFLVGASQWILRQATTAPEAIEIDLDTGLWSGLHGDRMTPEEQAQFHRGDWLIGYDFDLTMVRLAAMNLLLHGLSDPRIRREDALALDEIGVFDVVLANPPFTGQVDAGGLATELSALGTTKSEILFMERISGMLGQHGRAAVILPDGALFGAGKAPTRARKRLIDERMIHAVISLPSGCFRPYSGVKTSVILLDKRQTADAVWFYEVTGDGYTLDDRREPDSINDDLRYVAEAWRHHREAVNPRWSSPRARAAAGRAWTVSLDEVAERGSILAAGEYRRAVDTPVPSQDDVAHSLGALRRQTREIDTELRRLEGLLLSDGGL